MHRTTPSSLSQLNTAYTAVIATALPSLNRHAENTETKKRKKICYKEDRWKQVGNPKSLPNTKKTKELLNYIALNSISSNSNSNYRRMYWRRASRRPSAWRRHCSETVFRDNFVIIRRRSKRIAFLESVNFTTCVCMQIFNFRDGHVTTFRHHSGAYMCQMPGHRLSRLAKGIPSDYVSLSISTIGLW